MGSLTSLKTLELYSVTSRAACLLRGPTNPCMSPYAGQEMPERRRGCDWHRIAHIPRLQIVKDRPSSYGYHFFTGVSSNFILSSFEARGICRYSFLLQLIIVVSVWLVLCISDCLFMICTTEVRTPIVY
jgi:hypothetical protein